MVHECPSDLLAAHRAISINRRLLSRLSKPSPMSTGLATCPCLTSPPTTLPNGGTVLLAAQTYDYASTYGLNECAAHDATLAKELENLMARERAAAARQAQEHEAAVKMEHEKHEHTKTLYEREQRALAELRREAAEREAAATRTGEQAVRDAEADAARALALKEREHARELEEQLELAASQGKLAQSQGVRECEERMEKEMAAALEQLQQNSEETNLRLGDFDAVLAMLRDFPLLFDVRRCVMSDIEVFLRDLFMGHAGEGERGEDELDPLEFDEPNSTNPTNTLLIPSTKA